MTAEESDDVFKETEATTEEKEETKAEPEKEEEAEEETESGEEEESEGEERSEPPAEENEEEEGTVPVAALQSERQKRQALEERLAKYEAQEAPDKEKDPEGHERHMRMEMSRDLMRESHDDYDDLIAHYTEMEKANPALAQIVANDKNPAKLAYNLAKEDREIAKLQELSKSDDWKEFQKWKKAQPKESPEKPDRNKAALSVPNLNKATSVKARPPKPEDENVFAGASF
jgi:hypothetical protein